MKQCLTYGWNKKLSYFIHGALQLNFRTVLCVFNCDENVKFVVQVFPIWLAPILFLLLDLYKKKYQDKPISSVVNSKLTLQYVKRLVISSTREEM